MPSVGTFAIEKNFNQLPKQGAAFMLFVIKTVLYLHFMEVIGNCHYFAPETAIILKLSLSQFVITTSRCLWITLAHLSIVTCRGSVTLILTLTKPNPNPNPNPNRPSVDCILYPPLSSSFLGCIRVPSPVAAAPLSGFARQVTIDKCARVIHKRRIVVITLKNTEKSIRRAPLVKRG